MNEKIPPHPKIKYKKKRIMGDSSRVITRRYTGGEHRARKVIKRIVDLPETTAENLLSQVILVFCERHRDLRRILKHNLNKVIDLVPPDTVLSETKGALIGAYFTSEYSIESAALFNPSIVPHPDQGNLDEGCLRFIMSLRATGEGHISSIVFRSGVLDKYNTFLFDPISEYVETPREHIKPVYDKHSFRLKLNEMDVDNEVVSNLLDHLPEYFTYKELKETSAKSIFSKPISNKTFEIIFWLAKSNYESNFEPDSLISERVIFPVSQNESRGIEDARFVKFIDDNGEFSYYATYTAYNGFNILPQLMETKDFIKFKVITLNGQAVQNKGMALFPRKINDRYVMLSRQDGENNHIMFSDNIYFWQESEIIQEPAHPWEFIQVGNCGSPLETDEGWIVLTHGVGPMRQYCIGAMQYWRMGPTPWVSTIHPSSVYWGDSRVIMKPVPYHWDEMKIGPGAPPFKTDKGWLHIYHGVFKTMAGAVYRLGAALHDLNDPAKIIGVSDQWILQPEDPWEVSGYVPNVVFTCGAVPEDDGTVKIYWGGADTVMCAGTAVIDDLIRLCLTNTRSAL